MNEERPAAYLNFAMHPCFGISEISPLPHKPRDAGRRFCFGTRPDFSHPVALLTFIDNILIKMYTPTKLAMSFCEEYPNHE